MILFFQRPTTKCGFTLIELLIVITIIAILAAVVFEALDPARRLGDAANSVRWSEVTSILNATLKYQIDHDGAYPFGLDNDDGLVQVLGTGGVGGCPVDSCPNGMNKKDCLDLSPFFVTEYIASMPIDPNKELYSAVNTGYYINKDENGRLTVGACVPDNDAIIAVTR